MRAVTTRRSMCRWVYLSFLLIVGMAFLNGTASAAEVHAFAQSFGGGELSLTERSGISINQATGEIYVSDTGNGRVAKFTSSGDPDGTLATLTTPTFLAVDRSSGDIYVVDGSDNSITKFDPTGAEVSAWGTGGRLTGLGEIAGIAVEAQGNLWVYNGEGTMREFSAAGGLTAEWNSNRGVVSAGIAVDSTGDLYMVAGLGATRFDSAGSQLNEVFGPENIIAVPAVDESDDNLYLGSPGRIIRIAHSGEIVEEVGVEEGGLGAVSGLTVRSSTGDIYAANLGENDIVVFSLAEAPAPTVTIDLPTSVGSRDARLHGEVNPNGHPVTLCRFEVVSRARYEQSAFSGAAQFPCSGNPGSGAVPVPVEAEAEGLLPGTAYAARLKVRTIGGTKSTDESEAPQAFTTEPVAPTITKQTAISVTLTEAILAARISPGGSATTYRFEYLDEATFLAEGFASPATRSTLVEGPLPADNEEHEVAVGITGLSKETAYRYRVVADNRAGVAVAAEPAPTFRTRGNAPTPNDLCPNEQFRTGPGTGLPDCRAYELVTPLDKGGTWIAGYPDYFAAAPDGSAATYMSMAGSGFPVGGGAHQDASAILARLSGETWSSQRLLTPESFGERAALVGMSRDLRYAVIAAGNAAPGRAAEFALYTVDTFSGSVTQISPIETEYEIGSSATGNAFSLDAISNTGTRVLFESPAQLTPDAKAERTNLYLWDAGRLSLAGVLPDAEGGAAPPGGSFGGAYNWLEGEQTGSGGSSRGLYVEAIHAATSDVGQVYFTAGGTGQLYLRTGLAGSAPTTVRVSRPEPGVVDPFGPLPAAFQEATPDGRYAFFLSSQKLTTGAATGEEDEGKDLYRYDQGTGKLVDITAGLELPTSPNGAEVKGLIGVSTDGSSGYIGARAAIAPGAVAGRNNIYRFTEASEGNFHFSLVAQVSEGGPCGEHSGGQNWSASSNCGPAPTGAFHGRSARVTADATKLLFTNGADLYMYSASTAEAICISCNPTGAASLGSAELTPTFFNASSGEVPRASTAPLLTRNMSADGSRVFFQTPNSLLSEDTNGAPNCEYLIPGFQAFPSCMDVYEWEAPGAPGGTCKRIEVDGGCLYLLSRGGSKQPAYFVDASQNGEDVFIASTAPLVPSDRDNLYDVYDLASNGGLAVQQAAPERPCREDECRGATVDPSAAGAVGTSSFNGPGDAKQKAHKVNRHKRCKRRVRRCRVRHGQRHHRRHGDGKKQSHENTKSPRGVAKKGRRG